MGLLAPIRAAPGTAWARAAVIDSPSLPGRVQSGRVEEICGRTPAILDASVSSRLRIETG
jgi:hypothetical protein